MRFQVSRQFFRWPCGAGFQLGEYLLDRIEIWAVGRQEERLGASAARGLDAMLQSKGADPATSNSRCAANTPRLHEIYRVRMYERSSVPSSGCRGLQ
jgi:hypothetical protein